MKIKTKEIIVLIIELLSFIIGLFFCFKWFGYKLFLVLFFVEYANNLGIRRNQIKLVKELKEKIKLFIKK